jgi:hypothetical protein
LVAFAAIVFAFLADCGIESDPILSISPPDGEIGNEREMEIL